MTAKPARPTTFSWTAAAARWWDTLGHIYGCPCKTAGPGQLTADEDTARRVWACWKQAVYRIVNLEPRDHPHATRALYAFRDRARKP